MDTSWLTFAVGALLLLLKSAAHPTNERQLEKEQVLDDSPLFQRTFYYNEPDLPAQLENEQRVPNPVYYGYMLRHHNYFDPYYQRPSHPNNFRGNPPGGAPDHYHGYHGHRHPGNAGYHGDHEGEAGVNGDGGVIDVVHGLGGDKDRADNLEEDGAENTDILWRRHYRIDGDDNKPGDSITEENDDLDVNRVHEVVDQQQKSPSEGLYVPQNCSYVGQKVCHPSTPCFYWECAPGLKLVKMFCPKGTATGSACLNESVGGNGNAPRYIVPCTRFTDECPSRAVEMGPTQAPMATRGVPPSNLYRHEPYRPTEPRQPYSTSQAPATTSTPSTSTTATPDHHNPDTTTPWYLKYLEGVDSQQTTTSAADVSRVWDQNLRSTTDTPWWKPRLPATTAPSVPWYYGLFGLSGPFPESNHEFATGSVAYASTTLKPPGSESGAVISTQVVPGSTQYEPLGQGSSESSNDQVSSSVTPYDPLSTKPTPAVQPTAAPPAGSSQPNNQRSTETEIPQSTTATTEEPFEMANIDDNQDLYNYFYNYFYDY